MADVVVAKYKADLKDYNSQIKKGTGQAEKDFGKVDESASGLSKTVGKLGAALAAAFATERIISYTAEASKLAAAGEGIRQAFERVGDPKLLQGLRDATRGTVSDLELMKNAVKASNFKIPLQELAKLFEFARRRAKETGESVQFLVESITTGIGRKSPLILDNLGISAIELRKKLNGVSLEAASVGQITEAVGKVATAELSKMGAETDSTKDSMDRLTASSENLQEAIGKIANEAIGPLTDSISKLTQLIADDLNELAVLRSELLNASGLVLAKSLAAEEAILNKMEEEAVKRFGKVSDARARIIAEEIEEQQDRIAVIRELISEKQNDLDITEITTDEIERQIAAMKALSEQTVNLITLQTLADDMKALQKELKDAAIGGGEFWEILDRIQKKQKEMFEAQAQVNFFKNMKEDIEEMQAPTDSLTQSFDDLGKAIKEAFGSDAEASIKRITDGYMDATDEMIEASNTTKQSWGDSFGAATEVATTFYDFNRRSEEQQLNHQQQLLQRQLENQVITQEEYSEELRGIQQQRAESAKGDAMFHAIINTAQSVTSALAAYDYASAILFGVLGAAEIGTIAAQPIPQFAKGTKDAPAGLKWVGEEGPELIYDKGGYPIITHKESMKIMDNYRIPTVNIDKIESGGWDGLSESAKLQGFNDRNLLVAIDRHRATDKAGFKYIANELSKAMKVKRRGYA